MDRRGFFQTIVGSLALTATPMAARAAAKGKPTSVARPIDVPAAGTSHFLQPSESVYLELNPADGCPTGVIRNAKGEALPSIQAISLESNLHDVTSDRYGFRRFQPVGYDSLEFGYRPAPDIECFVRAVPYGADTDRLLRFAVVDVQVKTIWP